MVDADGDLDALPLCTAVRFVEIATDDLDEVVRGWHAAHPNLSGAGRRPVVHMSTRPIHIRCGGLCTSAPLIDVGPIIHTFVRDGHNSV